MNRAIESKTSSNFSSPFLEFFLMKLGTILDQVFQNVSTFGHDVVKIYDMEYLWILARFQCPIVKNNNI